MKILLLIVALMLPLACFALTPEEENFVSQLFTNRQKLVDLYQRSQALSAIADTVDSEALPLEIQKRRQERINLIAARDGKLTTVDVTKQAEKQIIITNYEGLIDAKESEISALQSTLDALINP